MNFLTWHYTDGIQIYIKMWKSMLDANLKFFSFPLLFRTLFSPWKRLSISSSGPGFSWEKFKNELSFNTTSRVVGFIARSSLILTSFIVTFFIAIFGLLGLFVWMLIPVLSKSIYNRLQKRPSHYANLLTEEMLHASNPLHTLFSNAAGQFVLDHTGLELQTLVNNYLGNLNYNIKRDYRGYADLLEHVIESGAWPADFWQNVEVRAEDLILAAAIWDSKRSIESGENIDMSTSNVKGIGTDLLFGYTPILDKFGKELLYEKTKTSVARGRGDLLARVDRILASNTNILLVGLPGVGKKTVLTEIAKKLDADYKRFIEVNTVELLSEIKDKDEKKIAMKAMLSEAARAGNVVLAIKDLPRLTNTSIDKEDFTDIFESVLEKNTIQVVATVTPEEYEKYMARNYKLMNFFEKVEVDQLNRDLATEVLIDRAAEIESTSQVTIPIPIIRKTVATAESLTADDTPFLKKVLDILESSVVHAKHKGRESLTFEDVATIASEKSGIPLANLTDQNKKRLSNLESVMQEKLIGQDMAIKLISQSLRTRTMGVAAHNKPVGTFLFLGPTGVGKTETAKVLSSVYYGHTDIMRFDMAEFIGAEGITRLIGSVHMNQPGILTTAIRNNPAGMILLDELEKASSDIFNILLTLLDEGYIMDAFGRKVDARNNFVIATSNAGTKLIQDMVVRGTESHELQKNILEHILEEQIFAPEFINRFDSVVVYEPLTKIDLTQIARMKLSSLKKRMAEKNIHVELHDSIHEKVAEDGYDPAFGARPMNRVINMEIGDVISQAMLSGDVTPGDRIILKPGYQRMEYLWERL